MKALFISDIHGNVSAVRKLRAREANAFDAVVVAGDIAADNAQEIFDILSSFLCPVMYVFGNWEYKLPYDAIFGASCHHLHLAPFQCGALTFIGFSGCPTQWGRNPIAERLKAEVRDRYGEILDALSEAEKLFLRAKVEVMEDYDASAARLAAKTRDRRRSEYRNKLSALELKRDRALARARKRVDQVKESTQYAAYLKALSDTHQVTLTSNRRALANALVRFGVSAARTVIVTHERLSKTDIDFPGVRLFMFGHRHGFKDTIYKCPSGKKLNLLNLL